MATQALKALVASARPQSVRERLSAKDWKKLLDDLAFIIESEKAGKAIPSHGDIAVYIASEYGVSVTKAWVQNWLAKARRGDSLV